MSCAFDHVFGGHASQEDVFKEVSGFVQSALDGFKVRGVQVLDNFCQVKQMP